MTFEIGQRVRFIKNNEDGPRYGRRGDTGRIIDESPYSDGFVIELDECETKKELKRYNPIAHCNDLAPITLKDTEIDTDF